MLSIQAFVDFGKVKYVTVMDLGLNFTGSLGLRTSVKMGSHARYSGSQQKKVIS